MADAFTHKSVRALFLSAVIAVLTITGAARAPLPPPAFAAGTATLAAPAMNPTVGYSTFHPWEVVRFTWSAVEGAATYVLQYSNDPNFPVGNTPPGVITGSFDNIADTGYSFVHALPEGTWYARVWAVGADRIAGPPSNAISYTVFYSNPVPPAPVPRFPLGNPTITLPFSIRWDHVVNPQPSGYEVQISSSASFSNNEAPLGVQLTNPEFVIKSLRPGTKFWRVRSHQGMSSPTTTAPTAWSATGSFTIPSPAVPVSIVPVRNPLYSGGDTIVEVQLSAGVPSTGASVSLTSSRPDVAPVPSTLAFQSGAALNQFQMRAAQVTTPTPITLSATLNGATASNEFTLLPPSLKSLGDFSVSVSGGQSVGMILTLNGQAPAGGAAVTLESSSPAVLPPATVTVPAGVCCTPVSMVTSEVTADTRVTVTARWNGGSVVSAPITVRSSPAPTGLTLSHTSFVGGGPGSVDGVVTIATTAPFDQSLALSGSNLDVTGPLPARVFIAANNNRGFFSFTPRAVTTSTTVTLTATGGGVSRSAALTVLPSGTPPPPSLASYTVNPSSVVAGTSATGTVTLSGAAPSGGLLVTLASQLPGVAAVPASLTIPAGATNGQFPITTTASSGTTTVSLSARSGDSFAFSAITVAPGQAPPPPPPSGGSAVLTVKASGRSGQRVTSSPSGISVAVGSTGSATFATGTSITLSVSNGRDAIWSGACSSGGSKRRTCTFTIAGNASVSANVQ